MLNIEKYENELRKYGTGFALTKGGKPVECNGFRCIDCSFDGGCPIKRMNWLLEEYKEPILTDKEKAYLKSVIDPRRDDDIWIRKMYFYKDTEHEYTVVTVYGNHPIPHYPKIIWPLLNFITTVDMPFKNMEPEKEYNPEELGL